MITEHSWTINSLIGEHLWRKKKKRSKVGSLLTSLSPLKKKRQLQQHYQTERDDDVNETAHTSSWLVSSKQNLTEAQTTSVVNNNPTKSQQYFFSQLKPFNSGVENEGDEEEDDDEFFLAISSTGLRTGSCPEFFWYPTLPYVNSGVEFNSNQVVPISRFVCFKVLIKQFICIYR